MLITTVITDGRLTAEIATKGAELKSLQYDGREYMWCGDPAFWGRTSPVLFPIVGSLRNGEFQAKDKTYAMKQHGFARDTEFKLVGNTGTRASFRLSSNAETLAKWPYEFELDIAYEITGGKLKVEWTVKNPGSEPVHFSIGAHPAFNCEVSGNAFHLYEKTAEGAYRPLQAEDYLLLNADSTLSLNKHSLPAENGKLPISQELFKNDALIFNDGKIKRVALADSTDREYLAVSFEAPLLGLWSPKGKNAPFVCIEPWYGVADLETADGIWDHKAYSNRLEAGQEFDAAYTIEIL